MYILSNFAINTYIVKRYKLLFAILFLVNGVTRAQIITTYAGNGGTGVMIEGASATSTCTALPGMGSFDAAGNYYTQNGSGRIRKITPTGIITTVAGGGTIPGGGDGGPATAAGLNCQGMHVDSAGNIYIADYYNNKVRKVDAATGIINTIAGTGFSGSSGNGGPATAAAIASWDVITDNAGNVYVTDNAAGTVRKIDAVTGIISDFSTINGWMCFDAGYNYLYIGGATRIYRKNMSTGVIDTIAGTGIALYNGDGIPATAANFKASDIALDPDGNIYIAEEFNDRVRMIDATGIIHTVAGTGASTYNGDNIAATAATIFNPEGLAFDKCGNLYIADDGNHRIRKITFDTSCGLGEDTSNHHVDVVNVNGSKAISVYPNPVWNELCVDGGYAGSYAITNITGYAVLQGAIAAGKNTIPMGQLPAGIYFIALTGADGERKVVKIVKE